MIIILKKAEETVHSLSKTPNENAGRQGGILLCLIAEREREREINACLFMLHVTLYRNREKIVKNL